MCLPEIQLTMYLHCIYYSHMDLSTTIRFSLAATLAVLLAPLSLAAENAADENPVIEPKDLAAEGGLNVHFMSTQKLPLYVNRSAGRVLDVLAAKQTITVLAIDRFGLQVRGRGKNGALTGWVGQHKAFAGDPKQLAKLRAFYQRQLEIERYVSEKRPAIGMNLTELKRILGKPTNHMVGTSEEGRTESLTWILKQKVDLNELLASGTDEDVLRMEVEVGRVEVALAHGLAKVITMNLDGGAADIPTVVPPVAKPFGPAPERKLAGK